LLVLTAVAGNAFRFSEPAAVQRIGLEEVTLDVRDDNGDRYEYLDEYLDQHFLEVLQAEEASLRTYAGRSDQPVWVFLGYFSRQKEGSQVHSPKHCYPGSGWSILAEREIDAPWNEGTIMSLVVSDGYEKRLVYYWFQTPESVLHDVFDLKVHLTKNAILRRPQEVVFARVSTSTVDDNPVSHQTLNEYATDLESQIRSLYRKRDEH